MTENPVPDKSRRLVAFALAAYALLGVAILNGYPMVYYDTWGYLMTSVTLAPEPIHPLVYALFMRMASLGTTPWLTIIAQAAITTFVLFAVFDYIFDGKAAPRGKYYLFMSLVFLLAMTTSLAWFVGLLLPDIFSGLALLCLFLLLYSRKLSALQLVAISGLLGLAVGTHTSHLLALCLVLAAVLVLRGFKTARNFWPCRSAKELSLSLAIPIFASMAFVACTNAAAGMGFAISPGGPAMLLGRLFDSGLAQEYLERHCPDDALTACKYLGNLPRTSHEFLWGSHPLLREMGGWTGSAREARRIVLGTIRQRPFAFVAECAKQMLRQSLPFDPEEPAHQEASRYVAGAMEVLMPADLPRFQRTQQSKGRLARIERKFARFQAVVYWSALLVSLLLVAVRRYRRPAAVQLFLLTILFLMANALITAGLSQVAGRYQSRVSWLMLLCCIAFTVPIMSTPDIRLGSDSTGTGRQKSSA